MNSESSKLKLILDITSLNLFFADGPIIYLRSFSIKIKDSIESVLIAVFAIYTGRNRIK